MLRFFFQFNVQILQVWHSRKKSICMKLPGHSFAMDLALNFLEDLFLLKGQTKKNKEEEFSSSE